MKRMEEREGKYVPVASVRSGVLCLERVRVVWGGGGLRSNHGKPLDWTTRETQKVVNKQVSYNPRLLIVRDSIQ
jgi:hypothetical protein